MPRPLFSHPMVFKEERMAALPTWTWAASPPATPSALPNGQIARNNAALASTTILYANVIDAQGRDHSARFAGMRGGGGAGQADLIVVTDRTNGARYKVTGITTLAGGAIYQFTVSLVAMVGTDPPTGASWVFEISYVATT